MKSESLSVSEHTDTRITGNITAWEDGKLFFSIPYDKGWELFVDEQKTELIPAFDMFLSANLTAGEHQILLKYEPRGLTAGLAFSIISILCAFSGLLIERRYLTKNAVKKQ